MQTDSQATMSDKTRIRTGHVGYLIAPRHLFGEDFIPGIGSDGSGNDPGRVADPSDVGFGVEREAVGHGLQQLMVYRLLLSSQLILFHLHGDSQER